MKPFLGINDHLDYTWDAQSFPYTVYIQAFILQCILYIYNIYVCSV